MTAIAICVNPMSGRDVRRLAARATNMTHEAKRDIVARVAAGADAVGVKRICVTAEPFRIASLALSLMPLAARVQVLRTPLAHNAADTEAAIAAFRAEGIEHVVSLGGDGTNRAIARCAPDITLIPLSTGTNNVFPTQAEPTIAGMVAGLAARGQLRGAARRCKRLHVRFSDGVTDVGLVDAALLAGDFVGNFLPFNANKLRRLLLTRAEPDAIGMSPIGGLIEAVEAEDDAGLLVEMGAGRTVTAPLSPGYFERVEVSGVTRIPFDTPVAFQGDGVLALDGDRDHWLKPGRGATVSVRRDGPWVIDVAAAMRQAVQGGLLAGP